LNSVKVTAFLFAKKFSPFS